MTNNCSLLIASVSRAKQQGQSIFESFYEKKWLPYLAETVLSFFIANRNDDKRGVDSNVTFGQRKRAVSFLKVNRCVRAAPSLMSNCRGSISDSTSATSKIRGVRLMI